MFHKIKGKILKTLKNRNTIIQFSPIRSGSTLVYNLLREVFPRKKIIKCHNYSQEYSKHLTVVTYRNPLDCIASSIQRYGLAPTDEVIEEQNLELTRNGIWEVMEIKNNSNVLMLRYEDFVNDFEIIYDELERFLKTEISLEMRNKLNKKYNIEEINKFISRFESFSEYNPITHWHGKHISSYKGDLNYYKNLFTENQIKYLEYIYKNFLIEFNYV